MCSIKNFWSKIKNVSSIYQKLSLIDSVVETGQQRNDLDRVRHNHRTRHSADTTSSSAREATASGTLRWVSHIIEQPYLSDLWLAAEGYSTTRPVCCRYCSIWSRTRRSNTARNRRWKRKHWQQRHINMDFYWLSEVYPSDGHRQQRRDGQLDSTRQAQVTSTRSSLCLHHTSNDLIYNANNESWYWIYGHENDRLMLNRNIISDTR